MTLDIEQIKSTALGRAWLSRFVELVWSEVLTLAHQRALLAAQRTRHSGYVKDAWQSTPDTVDAMAAMGIIESTGKSGRFKRLTPLGVEVYLHGRKQAGKRGGR